MMSWFLLSSVILALVGYMTWTAQRLAPPRRLQAGSVHGPGAHHRDGRAGPALPQPAARAHAAVPEQDPALADAEITDGNIDDVPSSLPVLLL